VALPGLQKLLISVATVTALVSCFPGTAGYAWAIAWLPVYGTVCHFDKVFGSDVSRDGYRIFLLNRGCDVDSAIRKIVAAASDLSVDPEKIIAIYHGASRAETPDEYLAIDRVESGLREYAGSTPGTENCAGGYCAIPSPASEDFITKWSSAYASYVRSQFLYTAKDGADYIASLLCMGPVAQGLMFIAYLGAAIFVVARVVYFRRLLNGSAGGKAYRRQGK
jgi:hypothetical protein